MNETTTTKVIQIIADQLGIASEIITPQSLFNEDLDCDSLDEIEIIMFIEDEFGVKLHDAEVEGIKTVGQAIKLVDKEMVEL